MKAGDDLKNKKAFIDRSGKVYTKEIPAVELYDDQYLERRKQSEAKLFSLLEEAEAAERQFSSMESVLQGYVDFLQDKLESVSQVSALFDDDIGFVLPNGAQGDGRERYLNQLRNWIQSNSMILFRSSIVRQVNHGELTITSLQLLYTQSENSGINININETLILRQDAEKWTILHIHSSQDTGDKFTNS